MMDERIVFLGGPTHPGSIGQRCDVIELVINGKLERIMIDCGLEFPDGLPELSYLDDGLPLRKVFCTHGHGDHVNGLGALMKKKCFAPDFSICCSPQTAAAIPINLNDGLKQPNPPHHRLNIARARRRLEVIPNPGEYELFPGLEVYIPQAGHIPGAAGIVIPTSSGKKGWIMGDWCLHDQPVTLGMELPSKSWPLKWIPDEIWGTDLTYGSDKKRPLEREKRRLIFETKRAISRGKKVIIAAFGIGRGPNVDVWLSEAGIPVWIDGAVGKFHEIYRKIHWSSRDGVMPELGEKNNIRTIESEEEREELIRSREPVVIVTTSGMGNFGPILKYFEAGLSRSDWCFFFTSYLAPRTNGDRLVKVERVMRARGLVNISVVLLDDEGKEKRFFVRADDRIRKINHFSLSAHGDLDDFIVVVEDVVKWRGGDPLERIILTHGTPETKMIAAVKLRPYAKTVIWGERNSSILLAA